MLHNDTLLSLDDMNQGQPQVISEALYMIHHGVGKVRMDKTRSLQETNKWSTFVMSSSEQSIETRLREAGVKIKCGQDVRLSEIPADRGHGVGAFDKPKTKVEAAAFAEKVEAASKQAYGTVAPAFLRYIIDEGVEEIAARGRDYVAKFVKKHIKANANEQVHRAARPSHLSHWWESCWSSPGSHLGLKTKGPPLANGVWKNGSRPAVGPEALKLDGRSRRSGSL